MFALLLGSVFVAAVVTSLNRSEVIDRTRAEQARQARDVARGLASRSAPLLAVRDDLRLAMMGASAAQFGRYRVLILDETATVRMDTGLTRGGQKMAILTTAGTFHRSVKDGTFLEFLSPAIGVQGLVGEVRICYPVLRDSAVAFSWGVFGGCLLACLSLIVVGSLMCHHWMLHVREAVATAQGLAHGDLLARCRRPAGGVIRDLQDGLHDLGGTLGEGANEVRQSFLELAFQTVEVLERRGKVGHGERVCNYAMLLARRLGLTREECAHLETAAHLHDLGEVFEPPERRVDAGVASRMGRIPQRGAELLAGITNMSRVAESIRYHRERFDGSGFNGLRGDRIPLGARILGIADAYDQWTTVCAAGGEPKTWAEALDALHGDRGDTFDPWLVDLFEEEIRLAPMPERGSTLIISTSGVVPYKVTDGDDAELDVAAAAYGEEWDGELEVLGEDAGGGDA